jgi:hypothetical protein
VRASETAPARPHPMHMRRVVPLSLAILLALCPAVAADTRQAAPPERGGRGRVLGTVIGAAAGFGVGLVAGLAWFDDAVNSDRKVWTTAIGFAGAGGAAGYFVGRSLDNRGRGPRPRPALGPHTIDVPGHLDWRSWSRDVSRAR